MVATELSKDLVVIIGNLQIVGSGNKFASLLRKEQSGTYHGVHGEMYTLFTPGKEGIHPPASGRNGMRQKVCGCLMIDV